MQWEGVGVHPPPSPARANFTLMTECTPETSGCYSVYSVADTPPLFHLYPIYVLCGMNFEPWLLQDPGWRSWLTPALCSRCRSPPSGPASSSSCCSSSVKKSPKFVSLKVLTNEKRGGLKVVPFDKSPFKLFTQKFVNKSVQSSSCERPKTAQRILFL